MALDSMQEIFDKIQAGRSPSGSGAGYGRGGAAGDGGGLL